MRIIAFLTDPAGVRAILARLAGDHHDAIHYFGMGAGGTYSPTASDRGLLVMNHEAITLQTQTSAPRQGTRPIEVFQLTQGAHRALD